MIKPKKSAGETTSQQTIIDIFKANAAFFRDEAVNYKPYDPLAENRLINAGSVIWSLLRCGAFKEDRFRLENVFFEGRRDSAKEGYELLWQELIKILRSRAGLFPYAGGCVKTYAEDCHLAANELEKEVSALANLKPAEPEQKATLGKWQRIGTWLWTLCEKILKVIVDAVLDRMCPK